MVISLKNSILEFQSIQNVIMTIYHQLNESVDERNEDKDKIQKHKKIIPNLEIIISDLD